MRIGLKLPDPLEYLIAELPSIEDLPYFESKTAANIALLRDVTTQLSDSPQITQMKHLNTIGKTNRSSNDITEANTRPSTPGIGTAQIISNTNINSVSWKSFPAYSCYVPLSPFCHI